MLKVEDIRRSAKKRFPIGFFRPDSTVLCLHGTTSMGKADLIHLYDAGVADVVVVDEDSSKLKKLSAAFGGKWKFEADRALDCCAERRSRGAFVDVVIADGSKALVDVVWEVLLPYMLHVASEWVVLRVSGDYLADFDAEPSPGDIETFCSQVHGVDVECGELLKRSSGSGGTYWAILKGRAGADSENGVEKQVQGWMYEVGDQRLGEASFAVRDHYGRHGCPKTESCGAIVNRIRDSIFRHEQTGVYRAYTSLRYARLPKKRLQEHVYASAVFDVGKYSNMDEVWAAARVSTKKKGKINRMVNRARNKGYFAKKVAPKMYAPDVYEVNMSKSERGGKPMRAGYRLSVEEMGGYPDKKYEYTPPLCNQHCSVMYGVFHPEPGRSIGTVVTNDRLVGYIQFLRSGNFALYARILGHGDHLNEGVMYFLHYHIIEEVLGGAWPELQYIMYAGFHSRGAGSGLQKWKVRGLFEPRYMLYDEVEDWNRPGGMDWIDV